MKQLLLISEQIEHALSVKYGLSSRSTTSYNIAICSTGSLRIEAIKDYVNKCGVRGEYKYRAPGVDFKDLEPGAFPAVGKFCFAKSRKSDLFSSKVKFIPAGEDKEWVVAQLTKEHSDALLGGDGVAPRPSM